MSTTITPKPAHAHRSHRSHAVKHSPPPAPAAKPAKTAAAKDEFTTASKPALPQPPPPAVPPSKVTAEARNSYTLDFNPRITDEKAARQAIFGSDQVPDGMMLKQKSDGGWTLTVLADEKKEAPNNIPWQKYQAAVRPEVQQFLSKNLPSNLGLPAPGKQAPVMPEYFAEEKAKNVKVTAWAPELSVTEDGLGRVTMKDTIAFDTDFGKPMTRDEAAKFFFGDKGKPRDATLEPMPKGAKEPAAKWRVGGAGLDISNPFLANKMISQANDANRRTPEWIGPKTAEAIKNKAMPPKGVEVKHPKPGISVWREGRGVFWYDEKKGDFQAFPRSDRRDQGSKMWDNWNTSYIMDSGLSPREAGPKVVGDMDSANKQIMFAFAAALASARTEEGVPGIVGNYFEAKHEIGPGGAIMQLQEQEAEKAKRANEK